MLTALQQARLKARPCGCGEATLDSHGNVRVVQSCPTCLKNALDFLRLRCYSANNTGGTSHERQLDMFDEGLFGPRGPSNSLLRQED